MAYRGKRNPVDDRCSRTDDMFDTPKIKNPLGAILLASRVRSAPAKRTAGAKPKAPAKKVSEETVKRRIKTLLDKYNAVWFMPVQGQFARKGVSDFIVCMDGGRYLAIEAKSSVGKATALQMQWLDKIHAAGGSAMLVGPEDMYQLEVTLLANAETAPANKTVGAAS